MTPVGAWAQFGHRHQYRSVGGVPVCNCGQPGITGGGLTGALPLPKVVGSLLYESGDLPEPPPPPPGEPQFSLTVPGYSSRPQAAAKLYLKFDGIVFDGVWGNTGRTPGVVPAYSVDSDSGSFSQTELSNIRQIWSRVAEAYSPFNIDVTTIDPGVPTARTLVRVVIGGSNAWYSTGAGGVAYIAGFTYANESFGTGWVFPVNLGGGNPKFVADATIHEAGHLFGLYHQQRRAADGTLISGYRSFENDAISAPHMGVAYDRPRGVWSDGVIDYQNGAFILQDDQRQIASTSANRYNHPLLGTSYWNGFGYRPDDHGNTFSSATTLTPQLETIGLVAGPGPRVLTATGVIERITDVDMFTFTNFSAGLVSIALDNAEFGAMLDVRLVLYREDQSVIADVNPPITTTGPSFGLDANWSGTLLEGIYYIGVMSAGGYGDVGQFTLTVTLPFASVPEPGVMPGLGVAGLLLLRRRS